MTTEIAPTTLDKGKIEGHFAAAFGDSAVVTGDRDRYQRGYRYGQGEAAAIIRPASTEQVREIVRYCHEWRLPLLLQGAHTGLVGAATPACGATQVLLCLDRLTDVINYAPLDRSITCGAGMLLSSVNALAAQDDLFFPIDLGADPSIGGMVATNTGGAKLIRYGDMRHNLLGLEVVLFDADATIWSDLGGLRKNNTGPDLAQIFSGSSGKLGIVTAATLDLQPVPQQSASALLVPRSLADTAQILNRLERSLGEVLVGFEGMSGAAMMMALRHHPALRNPFSPDEPPAFALLVEVASSVPRAGGWDVEAMLGEAVWPMIENDDALMHDALMTSSGDFHALRHSISDGLAREGRVLAFDISTRRSQLPALIERLSAAVAELAPQALPCWFGHFGDGGVHFNLVIQPCAPLDETALRDAVYAILVSEFHGSISAEHGIGPFNQCYFDRHVANWKKDLATKLQDAFAPHQTT